MSNPRQPVAYQSGSGRTLVYVPTDTEGQFRLIYITAGGTPRAALPNLAQEFTRPGEPDRLTVPGTEIEDEPVFWESGIADFDGEKFRPLEEYSFDGKYEALPGVIPGTIKFIARGDTYIYLAILDKRTGEWCVFTLVGDVDSVLGAHGVRRGVTDFASGGGEQVQFKVEDMRVVLGANVNEWGPEVPSSVNGQPIPKLAPAGFDFEFKVIGDRRDGSPHWMTACVTRKSVPTE